MKMPWKNDMSEAADGAPAAVLDSADTFEEQLAPLEQRRQELESRRAEIDAEIAQRTDARTSQLLAGEAGLEPAGILPLRETRFTVEQALAQLALQISDVKAARAAAKAIVAREQAELAFVAAVETVESAREELRSAVQDFLFTTFPALLKKWRSTEAEAIAAATVAGQSWQGSSLFAGAVAYNVLHRLERDAQISPSAFDPPR
jgi:chromosome segregation ATPase